jgi:hypothetical protein
MLVVLNISSFVFVRGLPQFLNDMRKSFRHLLLLLYVMLIQQLDNALE